MLNSNVSTQRPGVFSSYSVTNAFTKNYSNNAMLIIARASRGNQHKVNIFTQQNQVIEEFGQNCNISNMSEIVFNNHVSKIYCIAVSIGENIPSLAEYKTAFEIAENVLDISTVVCDSEDTDIIEIFKESICKSCNSGKERIGFAGAGNTPADLAGKINCEYLCLVTPEVKYINKSNVTSNNKSSIYLAAAYAGLVCASEDPAENLNSAEIYGEFVFDSTLSEVQIEDYLKNGVAVFEKTSTGTELIRAITSKQLQNNQQDSFRELSSVRIVNDVMLSVRSMLKNRLKGLKNNKATQESIRSQVVLELENKKNKEIISSYEMPEVYSKEDDPTICIVEISFNILYSIHQINLMAYIQV